MGWVLGRVVVVGAGVTGLSCAVRLVEVGHRVDVLARDLPLETTSAVAAALWYFYCVFPQECVIVWFATSYAAFAELVGDVCIGVWMLVGIEVLHEPTADFWWVAAVLDLAHVEPPDGFLRAWGFTAPVVDMPVYFIWLRTRLMDLGGIFMRISLADLFQTEDVVVNCAGLGSRRLVGDLDVQSVRGQVVVVEGFDLDRWWLDAAGPTYVVLCSDTVVVGGTVEEGDWSCTPSLETVAEIIRRAIRLVFWFVSAWVRVHRVGLRSVRPAVRLEVEERVVHCYGQGGVGVTVSWGCVDEVAELVVGLG